MKNLLMNEGYSSKKLYTHADGTYIFHKKKSFIDLCCGGGSLLLGHNHHTFKKALNNNEIFPEIIIDKNDKHTIRPDLIFSILSKSK